MNKKNKKNRLGRLVKWQKVSVVNAKTDYSAGERSPYWEWLEERDEHFSSDNNAEDIDTTYMQAADEGSLYRAKLIEEALDLLTPRQREAVGLLASGYSWEDAAKEMNIASSSFYELVERARRIVKESLGDGGLSAL